MNENQDYLAIFKDKVQKEKALMQMEHNKRVRQKRAKDQKKPAMFRMSFHKEIQEHQAQSELVRTQSAAYTPEEAEKASEKIESLAQLHIEKVKHIEKVLHEKQLRFLAFLTRNYSMLEFKAKKCEYYCYGEPARSMAQVQQCVNFCQKGISEAYKFSEQKQLQVKEKLNTCEKEAPTKALNKKFQKDEKPNLKEISEAKDPFHSWLKCYQDLLIDIDSLQDNLKSEFENYE